MEQCPGIEAGDFRGYLIKTVGRTAVERGFDVITKQRALTHINVWLDFTEIYVENFEANPENFMMAMLNPNHHPKLRTAPGSRPRPSVVASFLRGPCWLLRFFVYRICVVLRGTVVAVTVASIAIIIVIRIQNRGIRAIIVGFVGVVGFL